MTDATNKQSNKYKPTHKQIQTNRGERIKNGGGEEASV